MQGGISNSNAAVISKSMITTPPRTAPSPSAERIDRALGERTGIARFGWAYAPLDEALARAVVDLSGRPWPEIALGLEREMLGALATENVTHFFVSLATSLRAAVHVDVLRGDNDHHRAEAAFKALALALRRRRLRRNRERPEHQGISECGRRIMSADVLIVRTGAANLASVVAAFERLDRSVKITDNAFAVRNASRVVLPGVGAFAPVAERLAENGLGEAIRYRVEEDLPTLAVCLGLHLLAVGSEEGEEADGLGVLDVTASRYPTSVVVPQLGWNAIEVDEGCHLLQDGAAYFANSYRFTDRPSGWQVAWSDHGGQFVAAVERGNVLGCQFHPELSGSWGEALLERWLHCERGAAC